MLGFLRDYLLYIWNVFFGKSEPVSGSITAPKDQNTQQQAETKEKKSDPKVPLFPTPGDQAQVSESKQDLPTELKTKVDPTPAARPTPPKPILEVEPISSTLEPKSLPINLPPQPKPEQLTPAPEVKKPVSPSAFSEPNIAIQPKPVPSLFEEKTKNNPVDPVVRPIDLSYLPQEASEEDYEYGDDLGAEEEDPEEIEDERESDTADVDLDEKIHHYLKAVQEKDQQDRLKNQQSGEKLEKHSTSSAINISGEQDSSDVLTCKNEDEVILVNKIR